MGEKLTEATRHTNIHTPSFIEKLCLGTADCMVTKASKREDSLNIIRRKFTFNSKQHCFIELLYRPCYKKFNNSDLTKSGDVGSRRKHLKTTKAKTKKCNTVHIILSVVTLACFKRSTVHTHKVSFLWTDHLCDSHHSCTKQ